MADTFTFELVSPEKLLLSGDAEIVTVPGVEGDMGVLANHAPVMTSLRPGLIELKLGDGTESSFLCPRRFCRHHPGIRHYFGGICNSQRRFDSGNVRTTKTGSAGIHRSAW